MLHTHLLNSKVRKVAEDMGRILALVFQDTRVPIRKLLQLGSVLECEYVWTVNGKISHSLNFVDCINKILQLVSMNQAMKRLSGTFKCIWSTKFTGALRLLFSSFLLAALFIYLTENLIKGNAKLDM